MGGAFDDFVFAAHVVSLLGLSHRVLYRFAMRDGLDETVRFNPRFFILIAEGLNSLAVQVSPSRAWVTPFCIFLHIPAVPGDLPRWVVVPASDPASVLLRVCLNRLALDENPDKPSLVSYFWRMNVLR